mmetsp:Transcript_55971/g.137195  ORF Transcript_55971/g.137195 Transcript_55971/m.137195 type:complete len:234 (-) Transcript_55971:432-1133(-)
MQLLLQYVLIVPRAQLCVQVQKPPHLQQDLPPQKRAHARLLGGLRQCVLGAARAQPVLVRHSLEGRSEARVVIPVVAPIAQQHRLLHVPLPAQLANRVLGVLSILAPSTSPSPALPLPPKLTYPRPVGYAQRRVLTTAVVEGVPRHVADQHARPISGAVTDDTLLAVSPRRPEMHRHRILLLHTQVLGRPLLPLLRSRAVHVDLHVVRSKRTRRHSALRGGHVDVYELVHLHV